MLKRTFKLSILDSLTRLKPIWNCRLRLCSTKYWRSRNVIIWKKFHKKSWISLKRSEVSKRCSFMIYIKMRDTYYLQDRKVRFKPSEEIGSEQKTLVQILHQVWSPLNPKAVTEINFFKSTKGTDLQFLKQIWLNMASLT